MKRCLFYSIAIAAACIFITSCQRNKLSQVTEEDIRFIDSCGFDHIRLPIDEVQMWDETGTREEDAFVLLNVDDL